MFYEKRRKFFQKRGKFLGASPTFLLLFPRCDSLCGLRNEALWLFEGLMKPYEALAKGYNLRVGGK